MKFSNWTTRILITCAASPFLLYSMGCAAATPAAMPPYPEVWEKVLPAHVSPEQLGVSLLEDGEVLVATASDVRTGHVSWNFDTFFGRKSIDAVKTAREKNAVVYSDGTRAGVVRSNARRQELPDGRTIGVTSNEYRGCYRGPARDSVLIVDPASKRRVSRVFFYKLSKPEQFTNSTGETANDTGSLCPTEEQMTLRVPVVSLSGTFLPLPDGTVLFVVPSRSLLLRLDSNLESRSKLMNKQVFSFPIVTGDYMFMPSINGKDYGSGEEKNIRYQELLDDLDAYLQSLRREK
jgi:hypothetical protein